MAWRGKQLNDYPEYQRRLASGQVNPPQPTAALEGLALFNARGSTLVFLISIALVIVIVIGLFPHLRPVYETVTNGVADTDQVSIQTRDAPS